MLSYFLKLVLLRRRPTEAEKLRSFTPVPEKLFHLLKFFPPTIFEIEPDVIGFETAEVKEVNELSL